ncbi:MAG: hypothetical protein ACK56F_30760 [bacterium]
MYSINEGNACIWNQATKDYVQNKKFPQKGGKIYSLRYVGSMVIKLLKLMPCDFHYFTNILG